MPSGIVFLHRHNQKTNAAHRPFCAGVLLDEKRLLTAGHCVSGTLVKSGDQSVTVQCRDEPGSLFLHEISGINVHNRYDIAIVVFKNASNCVPKNHTLQISSQSAGALYSLHVTARERFEFEILESSKEVTYVQDHHVCLDEGMSGYPVFLDEKTLSDTRNRTLFALLISGTTDCPSTQILLHVEQMSSWISTHKSPSTSIGERF